jgi:ferredoxin-NADP reductase
VNDDEDETVIKLLCGCSNLENRYLLEELKDLAAFWNFSFVHFVNSPDGEIKWGEKVERRRILEADVKNALPVPLKSFVLICGTDKFCDSMKNIVQEVGAPFYCF